MHLTLLLCSMKLPLRKSSRIFSLIQVGKTCNELVKFMTMNENECFHRQDHRFLELSYSNIQISMSSNWWFVHMTSTMWVFNILHRRSSTPIRWIFRSLAILAIGSPWHKSKLQNHQLFLLLLLVITIVPWPELGGTAGGEWPNFKIQHSGTGWQGMLNSPAWMGGIVSGCGAGLLRLGLSTASSRKHLGGWQGFQVMMYT